MVTINNVSVDFDTLLKYYKNNKNEVAKKVNELTGAPIDYVMELLEEYENGVPIGPVIDIEPEIRTVKINNVDINLDELLKRHKANSVEAAVELKNRTGVSVKKAFRILENYEKGIPIIDSKQMDKKKLFQLASGAIIIIFAIFIIVIINMNLDSNIETAIIPTNTPVAVDVQTLEPAIVDAAIETPKQTSEATKKPKKTSKPKKTPKPTKKSKTTNKKGSYITRKASELKLDGKKIIATTENDMKKYDYIKDVYIKADESEKEINIVVQVPSYTDTDTAKMAGEDVARYLAFLASTANSYYKTPGSDDLGSLYEEYDLLIYVDDGYENLSLYGAKVTSAKQLTWR